MITEVLPGDTYRVMQLQQKRGGQCYSTTAHVSQLKAWRCHPDPESSGSESPSESDGGSGDSSVHGSRPQRRRHKPDYLRDYVVNL